MFFLNLLGGAGKRYSERKAEETKLKDDRKDGFDLPAPEEYIGTHIQGDLGGVKVSNKNYKKYYKGMI